MYDEFKKLLEDNGVIRALREAEDFKGNEGAEKTLKLTINVASYLHERETMKVSDTFAQVCFLILMQNGDGIMDKSPEYILEKSQIQKHGVNAFRHLDIHNMRKLRGWCELWKVEMPIEFIEYLEASEKAAAELAERGFEI
jgi:hypothetical protein